MKLPYLLCATVFFCASAAACAQVVVKDSWVRATVPQQQSTGAFMQITAPRDARLVDVRSPAAGIVEIHEMRMDNNVMKMRAVDGLDLPAGKTVALAPGGYHVMMMDLKTPIKAGDSVPLTLVIEEKNKQRQTIEVKAVARALGSTPESGKSPMAGEHMHQHQQQQ